MLAALGVGKGARIFGDKRTSNSAYRSRLTKHSCPKDKAENHKESCKNSRVDSNGSGHLYPELCDTSEIDLLLVASYPHGIKPKC